MTGIDVIRTLAETHDSVLAGARYARELYAARKAAFDALADIGKFIEGVD